MEELDWEDNEVVGSGDFFNLLRGLIISAFEYVTITVLFFAGPENILFTFGLTQSIFVLWNNIGHSADGEEGRSPNEILIEGRRILARAVLSFIWLLLLLVLCLLAVFHPAPNTLSHALRRRVIFCCPKLMNAITVVLLLE